MPLSLALLGGQLSAAARATNCTRLSAERSLQLGVAFSALSWGDVAAEKARDCGRRMVRAFRVISPLLCIEVHPASVVAATITRSPRTVAATRPPYASRRSQ